jgi:hypothetical protein
MTVLSVAEHLTRVYPLRIVYDESVPDGIVMIDHKLGTIRVNAKAAEVQAGMHGPGAWSNWRG